MDGMSEPHGDDDATDEAGDGCGTPARAEARAKEAGAAAAAGAPDETRGLWRLPCGVAAAAFAARKRPTLGDHFPATHGDSAQTKGTMLLSIVSSP